MPDPEMWVGGNVDSGAAAIYCSRERCMVAPGTAPGRYYYLEIELPYKCSPKEIDRIWHQHRIEHSS